MDFFGIGPMELLFILLIAFLVFGPGKLPEIGRQLGKAVREFRKYSSAMTADIRAGYEKELKSPPTIQGKSEGVVSEQKAAPCKTGMVQPQNTDE